jgi:hypothetical protein
MRWNKEKKKLYQDVRLFYPIPGMSFQKISIRNGLGMLSISRLYLKRVFVIQ